MIARELKAGDQVMHSGVLCEVASVRVVGLYVVCRLTSGGEISFMANYRVVTV